jgi:thiamine kinase-like enzyme
MAMGAKELPRDDPSRNDLFDYFEPLVLTHQDLNVRNVIVGEDGRLWIVDWG